MRGESSIVNPSGFSEVPDKRTGLAGRGTSRIKLEEDGEDVIERGSFIKRDTMMTTKGEGGRTIGREKFVKGKGRKSEIFLL